MERGCPPPQPTRGSVERRKLPSVPSVNGFWCILSFKKPCVDKKI